ncbi:MAG: C69 family dipeptidase [Bacteroidota bacterium]
MKSRFLITFILISVANSLFACTSYLITKGASTDGSTMISYAADSHVRYGELYWRKGGSWPEGSMVKLYDRSSKKFMGEIPQAKQTYNVIGFMNENQVSIGETTFGGLPMLDDTTGTIDYGSLMFLAMDRAKTAREAIKIIGELVEKYGYYGGGESFSIGDPNEVWIMEIVGKGTELVLDPKSKTMINKNKGALWVAIRIPDGYISAHANQARITTFALENGKTSISSKNLNKINIPTIEVVYAYDVIQFARQKKLFTGKDAEFSFSDTYAPITFDAARFSEIRVWSMFKEVKSGMNEYLDYVSGKNLKHRMPLYIKPDRKVTPNDLMGFKRDHLEGTPFDMTKDAGAGSFGLPYRWRPLTWKLDGKEYLNERATATQQTGFSFIAQMRSWLPAPIGGILWFSVDDAASTVYVPMYCGINSIPHSYAEGNGDMLTYSENAAFWSFNKVANFCYLRYNLMMVDVKKLQNQLESTFASNVPEIDKAAQGMWATNPAKACNFLTEITSENANKTVERWNKLFEYLLVKYIDGNVKREENGQFKRNAHGFPAGPIQPGYNDAWKKQVIESNGEMLFVK